MASRQTVEDQGTSATWNNTGATSSAGSSPSQNRESTPGARWTPPNEGADAGQPGTKAANRRETEPPKHEPQQRANVRWTETRSQTQNVRPPPLSIVMFWFTVTR